MAGQEPLVFTEDADNQIILVTTPKRKQKIKIFVPIGNFARWFIVYEDGKYVSGLSDSSYLSRKAAMQAVIRWEVDARKTQEAKQFELFGDKEPPVLKRKKISGARV